LTFILRIDDDDALPVIRQLPEKSRRIVDSNIKLLAEDPYPGKGGDKECLTLRDGVKMYRLHIARSITVFYKILNDTVYITEVLTTEQAHKKYNRL
jgi:mRNA-degrading endonuclease RelE of RelBE toxin-antitoxin system